MIPLLEILEREPQPELTAVSGFPDLVAPRFPQMVAWRCRGAAGRVAGGLGLPEAWVALEERAGGGEGRARWLSGNTPAERKHVQRPCGEGALGREGLSCGAFPVPGRTWL